MPLYNEDMWWPASDYDNCWVEVGNVHILGLTHIVIAGYAPTWGTTTSPLSYKREFVVILLTGKITIYMKKNNSKSDSITYLLGIFNCFCLKI